jgi:hypothetical protein
MEIPLIEIANISTQTTPQHTRGYDVKGESEFSLPPRGDSDGYQQLWSSDYASVKPDTRVQIMTTNTVPVQGRYRGFDPLASEMILEQEDGEMRIPAETILAIGEKNRRNNALTGALVGATLDAAMIIAISGSDFCPVAFDLGGGR